MTASIITLFWQNSINFYNQVSLNRTHFDKLVSTRVTRHHCLKVVFKPYRKIACSKILHAPKVYCLHEACFAGLQIVCSHKAKSPTTFKSTLSVGSTQTHHKPQSIRGREMFCLQCVTMSSHQRRWYQPFLLHVLVELATRVCYTFATRSYKFGNNLLGLFQEENSWKWFFRPATKEVFCKPIPVLKTCPARRK